MSHTISRGYLACSASNDEAQARRRAGREVLHQHVGAREQRIEDRAAPARA